MAAEISGPRWFHREKVIDDSVADDDGADDDIDGINITEVADSSSMKDAARVTRYAARVVETEDITRVTRYAARVGGDGGD